MDNNKTNKCEDCKFFNRHYIIADNKLSLLRAKIGTCKLQQLTNVQYPEVNRGACALFKPYTDLNYDEDIINELRAVANNLDTVMWIIKEERRKRKENSTEPVRYF